HEALDFNCRSRREGDRGGGLLSCAHAKPLRCEQGTSPDWFILYKVTRESGMGKSPPHATRPWEPAAPRHPARGNRPPHVTPPVGTGPPPSPPPWEWAIGNGESGRKTSPHRTPPPFFHRRCPPLYHFPFPRFPIPDCRFPRAGWRKGVDDCPFPRAGWRKGGPYLPPASARATASARWTRTGPSRGLSRVGSTRFVSRMMNRSCCGSIQMDVPVKPVWPKARFDNRWPAEFVPLGTSQPSARLENAMFCTCVNVSTAAALTMRTPPSSPCCRYICAKRARSCALLNRPA